MWEFVGFRSILDGIITSQEHVVIKTAEGHLSISPTEEGRRKAPSFLAVSRSKNAMPQLPIDLID